MSDNESLFEEYDEEDEINDQRELIAVVRCNPFLYNKTEKLYANGDVKTNAWTQIGASLTHQLKGKIAEKKFYALRQRFGKERRKVLQSMPRSGAGTDQPTYKPTWVLYKDLTFLEDIIKPRKTSSNYKSKSSHASSQVHYTSSSMTSIPSGSQVAIEKGEIFSTISPFSATFAAASQDTSNCWNSDLSPFTGSDKTSNASESPFSSLPATSPKVTQTQRAMSKIDTKRKVPSSDSVRSKKRQNADTVSLLVKQSEGLTDLAAKIGQAIMVPPTPPSASSATVVPTTREDEFFEQFG